MEILSETGGKIQGLWTGGVKTKVRMSLLSIPILANYKISERWKLVFGPYLSYMMNGDFNGNVYEGHLRTPDATGSRVNFTGDNIATYDFSETSATSNGDCRWVVHGAPINTLPYTPI